jgi:hypothetical protein
MTDSQTMTTQKLALDTVQIAVADDYVITFAPEPYLILGVGLTICEFNHPSMVAKQTTVFEFKHERASGHKFWTAKPGVLHYFVVPKNHIEVAIEKGYSYVTTYIGGQKVVLNVSGGSGPPWKDWVSRSPHTCINYPVKTLKAIANNSLTPTQCNEQNIAFDILENRYPKQYVELAVAPIVRKWLQKNKGRLYLKSGWNHDELGPFEIEEHCMRRRAYFVLLHDGYITRTIVPYKGIDWTRTAEINNIPLPESCAWNKIGKVVLDHNR